VRAREREGERDRERIRNLPKAPIGACRSPGSSARERTSEARRPCARLGSRCWTQTCRRARSERCCGTHGHAHSIAPQRAHWGIVSSLVLLVRPLHGLQAPKGLLTGAFTSDMSATLPPGTSSCGLARAGLLGTAPRQHHGRNSPDACHSNHPHLHCSPLISAL
jgi:hypothetical protein